MKPGSAASEMPAWGLPVVILFSLGVIWGCITNIARFVGQTTDLPPLSYAFWTLLIGACLLFGVNFFRKSMLPISSRHLVFYLIAGALGSAIPTSNLFWVLNHISAGQMSIALTTVPLFTYILALIIRSEPLSRRRMLGVVLGFIGSLIILASRDSAASDAPRFWFALAFFTPLFYALGNHFTARFRPPRGDSLSMASGMVMAAAIILFCVASFDKGIHPLWQEPGELILLVLMHGLLSGVAFTLFFVLIRIAGPVYFSQVAYLVCIFGIAIGMLFFGERHGPLLWLAVVVIFSGVLLVNMTQQYDVKPDQHGVAK